MSVADQLDLEIAVPGAAWQAAVPRLEDHCRRAAEATFTAVWREAAVAEAALVLTHDAQVRQLNRDYRGHDAATNKFDLLCPRPGCGSIILKNEVATLVTREGVQIEPITTGGRSPLLPELPSPGLLAPWWRVTPNAMAFENIGFSRSVVLNGKTISKEIVLKERSLVLTPTWRPN